MPKKIKAEEPVVAAAPVETDGYDYTAYLGKEPTRLQATFADWIVEKTGKTFGNAKEEAAWKDGVRLGVALRMKFQASDENQAELARAKAERDAAAALETEEVPAPKAEKAPKGKKATTPEQAEIPPAAAPKPAKKAGGKRAPF